MKTKGVPRLKSPTSKSANFDKAFYADLILGKLLTSFHVING